MLLLPMTHTVNYSKMSRCGLTRKGLDYLIGSSLKHPRYQAVLISPRLRLINREE